MIDFYFYLKDYLSGM